MVDPVWEVVLREIEEFLIRHNMAASTFGRKCMNDSHLVYHMRDGRKIWPHTAEKIRQFMTAWDGHDMRSWDDQYPPLWPDEKDPYDFAVYDTGWNGTEKSG